MTTLSCADYPTLIQTLKTSLPQVTDTHQLESERQQQAADHRLAAVLVLLFEHPKGLSLLLTKRSGHLPNHAGQISFPGGTIEQDDSSVIHAALREAEEETGLDASELDILGGLTPMLLPSGFKVSPVVASLGFRPELKANPDEVDEIIRLPLSHLTQEGVFKEGSLSRNGVRRSFYYFDYKEHYVWGATAAMLRELAQFLIIRHNEK